MRVPAFSFILHLFAVTSLLGSAFHHDSNSTKQLADRQPRAQDSRAKRKVIGDEERMRPKEISDHLDASFFHLLPSPTRPIENHIEYPFFPTNSGKEHTQYKLAIDFVARMETILAYSDKHTINGLIRDFHAARKSMNTGKPMELDSPTIRLILSVALQIKPTERQVVNEANWNTILNRLIYYGFNRKEVELILRTAGYNDDVQDYIISYDNILSAMSTNDILRLKPLHNKTDIIARAAYLLITRAGVGQAQSRFIASDWETFLTLCIRAKYGRDPLKKILLENSVPQDQVNNILGHTSFSAVIERNSHWWHVIEHRRYNEMQNFSAGYFRFTFCS